MNKLRRLNRILFQRQNGLHTFPLLFIFASLATGHFYYSKGDENKCISIALFGSKKVHLILIKCVGFQIAF